VARLEAVVWSSRMQKMIQQHGPDIKQVFQTGLAIRLRVTADYHDRFGFKLIVEDADPSYTMGRLEMKRREVLSRLEQEGLLKKNRRHILALVPQRLAIISSLTAAGYADFRQQLLQNPYRYDFNVELFTAAMQGELAVSEIIRAIQQIDRRTAQFDAIVVIRGGGARMDLLAFDDELLCRAVAQAKLPVLTGIGHETDEVLLDRVAFLALKTPTAVAAFLLERVAVFESRLLEIGRKIQQLGHEQLYRETHQLIRTQDELRLVSASNLQRQQLQLDEYIRRLPELSTNSLKRSTEQLDQYEAILTALRPETTLARGYAMLVQAGKIVDSLTEIDQAKALTVKVQDGEIAVRVKRSEIEEKTN
ncbi:MAG: exodeoxyribonuclease VII large subunit, partial [Bacteroidota bacterium]